jgi:hypothetical protein
MEEGLMKLTTVESSMIHAVGYDAAAHELEVVFNSGRIYRYQDVPQTVYDELLVAESKGRYMLANVIDVYSDYELRRRR